MLLDLHVHTSASPDGYMSPERVVRWAVENGLDGIAVTDHNTTEAVLAVAEAARVMAPHLLVIPGYEWTNGIFHANVLGTTHMPPGRISVFPSPSEIAEWVRQVHEHGGLIQLNHPGSRDTAGLSALAALHLGFDAIEAANGKIGPNPLEREVLRFCSEHGLTPTAGSDVHDPREGGLAFTQIPGLQGGASVSRVLQALKRGENVRLMCGPRLPVFSFGFFGKYWKMIKASAAATFLNPAALFLKSRLPMVQFLRKP